MKGGMLRPTIPSGKGGLRPAGAAGGAYAAGGMAGMPGMAAMKRPMPTQAAQAAQMFKKARVAGDGSTFIGELRFRQAESVEQALQLNGTEYGGSLISIEVDTKSKDGTKIIIRGLAANTQWAHLKDHFTMCGEVVFADIKADVPCVGSVRFSTAEEAQQALGLNGTILDGQQLEVRLHPGSKDGTKLQLLNLPANLEWQELKDHFASAGLSPIFVETSSGGDASTAEVRYDDPAHTQAALMMLNGSVLAGGTLSLEMDLNSKDSTKLVVTGVPPGVQWQEVKDHFAQCGQVGFVQVHDKAGAKGKGGAKGGFGFGAMGAMGGMMMAGMPPGARMLPNGMMVMANGLIMAPGGFGGCGGGGRLPIHGGAFPGKQMAGSFASMGGGVRNGEVRYDNPQHAQVAAAMLNGSQLGSSMITVTMDMTSKDGSKVLVSNVGPEIQWQELKDHFAQAGQVAFANVKG